MRHDERLKAFRIALIQRNTTAKQVAKAIGVTDVMVYSVVAGRSRSGRVEERLMGLFPEVFSLHPLPPVKRRLARQACLANPKGAQG